MSTKDIATITHKTPKTIENIRIRIRKKLNISGSTDNLGKYLTDLQEL
jgi:DNA-binding NarL/FixJ family response regulator